MRFQYGLIVFIGSLALCVSSASAWWDTVVTVKRPVPLISEHEAESMSGVDQSAIQQDAQANGGLGGKAVLMQPGGKPVNVELDLKPGVYALFGIMRDPSAAESFAMGALTLKDHATGKISSWSLPIKAMDDYNASAMFYFPVYTAGKYTASLSILGKDVAIDPALPAYGQLKKDAPNGELTAFIPKFDASPRNALLLDRLELRDVYGNIHQTQQLKHKRMLTSDDELAQIRQAFMDTKPRRINMPSPLGAIDLVKPPAWYTQGNSPEERQEISNAIWSRIPDYNTMVGHDNNTWNGLVKQTVPVSAALWQKTGNPQIGWAAAVYLIGMAEKYPALDFYADGIAGSSNLTAGHNSFGISTSAGKNVYRGWAGPANIKLMEAYDQLFDYIKDNQPLADFVHTKIPTINTPSDLVRFLDRNLLHATVDGANRGFISGGDSHMALAALILGPGPDADWLLANGIFRKISMNMTHRGGIDDHAISSYNRDGVHFIGSVGYYSQDLLEIAEILAQYRKAGGNPRFDLSDTLLYPHVMEAQKTIEQAHFGGGFRILQGDAGDLRNGRLAGKEPWPSRILGGAGLAILEEGQFQKDPSKQIGVALYYGIGRGHAHADTLNLELVAHGVRAMTDLGGRHEGKLHGKPNMRSNRVHNLVEIDDQDFHNPYAGSTTSGTGWNTAFFPSTGAQFMEHYARASSHPYVSLYTRQTTLIDIPLKDHANADDADARAGSYLVDVFRVKGGKIHNYNFHGGVSDAVVTNTQLSDQLDADAAEFLAKHKDGSKLQGVAPQVLQADWRMTDERQKAYQKNDYNAEKPVTTRLNLFGVQGQKVLVGNATSDYYKYDFPFLSVRNAEGDDQKESVYPAVIEAFAGESLIASTKQLVVSPEDKQVDRGVALEVKTTTGVTDVIYSSIAPEREVTIDQPEKPKTTVAGKFAYVSTDAKGLRSAKLVGGNKLQTADIQITTKLAAYQGSVSGVMYADRALTIDAALPAKLMVGQIAQIGGGNGVLNAFKIEAVSGKDGVTRVTHAKTARYYQSAILSNDDENNGVVCEIDPPIFGSDSHFINGTTVSNEAGTKFARVTIEESDRWMHLGWPGYRGSYPTAITMDQIPDTNKDGKHILKLHPKPGAMPKESEDASTPLDIQVTRIDKDGQTFHFKMPEDPNYKQGGWQYNYRMMTNEDNSQTFRAVYPGSSYIWKLDRKTMTPADFTDADEDGLVKMAAYLYGPGDRFELDTFVHMTRQNDDSFLINTNTPFELSLSAKLGKSLQISQDGKTYKPLASKIVAGMLQASLSADDLADGKIWLRVTK